MIRDRYRVGGREVRGKGERRGKGGGEEGEGKRERTFLLFVLCVIHVVVCALLKHSLSSICSPHMILPMRNLIILKSPIPSIMLVYTLRGTDTNRTLNSIISDIGSQTYHSRVK